MARPNGISRRGSFEGVETWVFDLDNTLYPADCNLFAEIDRRMGEFIAAELGLSLPEAQRLRQTYYYQYGTTLAGLMQVHGVSPQTFLDYVHDIDLSVVAPAPDLAEALDTLPGRKFIFTNGSRRHAEAVAGRLGLHGHFEDVFDIHAADFVPKPTPQVYEGFLRRMRVTAFSAAMFDDLPHNLLPAHALGMTTVLVACGTTDHPEHQAIASWTKLPDHIHHCTEALAPFLAEIGAGLAAASERCDAFPVARQFCLT
jgi:putative hydrolase of the HAD superfamily